VTDTLVLPQSALIDVPVSSRAAIADVTPARASRLDVLGAGGAGELTPARAAGLGVPADVANPAGSLHAKLATLLTRLLAMPLVITSTGVHSLGPMIATNLPASPTLASWMGVGRACYIPFRVEETITVTRMVLEIGVVSGFISMGIYDSALNQLVTTGAIACPAAGLNVVTIPLVTLSPGRYYMAMSADNVTMTLRALAGVAGQGLWGFFYQNIHPLPVIATPGASANVIIPVIGVSLTAAIV